MDGRMDGQMDRQTSIDDARAILCSVVHTAPIREMTVMSVGVATREDRGRGFKPIESLY